MPDLLCNGPECTRPKRDFFLCLRCWLKVPRYVRHELFEAWGTRRKQLVEQLKVRCVSILEFRKEASA